MSASENEREGKTINTQHILWSAWRITNLPRFLPSFKSFLGVSAAVRRWEKKLPRPSFPELYRHFKSGIDWDFLFLGKTKERLLKIPPTHQPYGRNIKERKMAAKKQHWRKLIRKKCRKKYFSYCRRRSSWKNSSNRCAFSSLPRL